MNHEHHHGHHEHHHGGQHFVHAWPFLRHIESLGDEYLIRKAPRQMPHHLREVISKVLPVLALIVAILALPGILGSLLFLFGIAWHSAANRGYYWVYSGASYIVVLIQTIITVSISVFYFKAFDPLRKRHIRGWVYVFYAGLLGFVANLLNGSIIGAIIGFLLGMYLLFQAKELYHH